VQPYSVEVDGGQEQRAPDGLSIFNAAEARAAVAVVEALLAAGGNSVGAAAAKPVGLYKFANPVDP
jgi:hypothetical protein